MNATTSKIVRSTIQESAGDEDDRSRGRGKVSEVSTIYRGSVSPAGGSLSVITVRKCRKCEKTYPLSKFRINPRSGFRVNTCTECYNQYQRDYRLRRPEADTKAGRRKRAYGEASTAIYTEYHEEYQVIRAAIDEVVKALLSDGDRKRDREITYNAARRVLFERHHDEHVVLRGLFYEQMKGSAQGSGKKVHQWGKGDDR